MGYLHAGHLSLVREARKRVGKNGKVVVSIYVNPTQFAPTEDLAKYPRDLKRDLKLCREAGVDVVFTPSDAEMYPGGTGGRRCEPADGSRCDQRGHSTYVVEEKLSQSMEGAARPTHFRGVTTVVAKLFNLVLPDVAVFGQKDFQQAAIIQRMVADLNFPVNIIVAPTLREADGLAMSSRNKFLDAEAAGAGGDTVSRAAGGGPGRETEARFRRAPEGRSERIHHRRSAGPAGLRGIF